LPCGQASIYADRILRRAKPPDLPAQQVAKIEFAIDLETADALSIIVPPALLTRVDEVIE